MTADIINIDRIDMIRRLFIFNLLSVVFTSVTSKKTGEKNERKKRIFQVSRISSIDTSIFLDQTK